MVLLRVVSRSLQERGIKPLSSVYDTHEGVKLHQQRSRTNITVSINTHNANTPRDLSIRVWSVLEDLGYILEGQPGNRDFIITGKGKPKPPPSSERARPLPVRPRTAEREDQTDQSKCHLQT